MVKVKLFLNVTNYRVFELPLKIFLCLLLNNLKYQPIIIGNQKIHLSAHSTTDYKKYF